MPDDCLFCDKAEQFRSFLASGTMYARMDRYPATPGHAEIVPYRHVESFFDLTSDEARDAYRLLAEARAHLAEIYAPDGWNVGINDGSAAGQTIPHLHIHVIPRYRGDQADPRGGIRLGLPNGDPSKWAKEDQS